MNKPVNKDKIKISAKRKAKLIGKISYISPCTQADINYWYRRNTLVFSTLLVVFIWLIYAALSRETQFQRFNQLSLMWTDNLNAFDLIAFIANYFVAELILCFFTYFLIKNLFAQCPIKIVGEKGFAFVGVKRNYTVTSANIALFSSVKRMTITIPRGGIGKHYKWYGDSRLSVFDYAYHPFLESTHFIHAVLESWHKHRILKSL